MMPFLNFRFGTCRSSSRHLPSLLIKISHLEIIFDPVQNNTTTQHVNNTDITCTLSYVYAMEYNPYPYVLSYMYIAQAYAYVG